MDIPTLANIMEISNEQLSSEITNFYKEIQEMCEELDKEKSNLEKQQKIIAGQVDINSNALAMIKRLRDELQEVLGWKDVTHAINSLRGYPIVC